MNTSTSIDPDDAIDDALTWLTVNDKTEWSCREARKVAKKYSVRPETLFLIRAPDAKKLPGEEWEIQMGLHPKGWFESMTRPTATAISPDVSFLAWQADIETGEHSYYVRRYRPIARNSAQWRKISESDRGHYTLEWRHLLLENYGTALGGLGYTYWNGARWEAPYISDVPDLERAVTGCADMACGFHALSSQWWFVEFAYEGTPFVSLKTDPIGAREAFRLRDIPPGRSRRAALRHWVKEHSRRSRVDISEETRVREHLRGADTFNWNGIRCRIRPSIVDRLRAENSSR